ncbi:MAG TPA: 3,4-dihydroxy-2-butanone-4-phosphate synthase [Aldersonia sp.]
METSIARVQQALSDLVAGRPVVLVGSRAGDPDGYLVLAAEKCTSSTTAFLVRHTSGFVCAAVTREVCERVGLPPMAGTTADPVGGYYTVSVDTADGGGTGISAADRARTLNRLASPTGSAEHFSRPGHVVPRRAHDRGVFATRGAAEAITDLGQVAGINHVGAFAALVSPVDATRIATPTECRTFARDHGLTHVGIDDVVAYRRTVERHVGRVFTTVCASGHGTVTASGFHSDASGADYVAYRIGPDRGVSPLVHVRRETNFAPHLGVADPDLDAHFARIAAHGGGVVLIKRRANDLDTVPHSGADSLVARDDRAGDVAEILNDMAIEAPVLLDPPADLPSSLATLGISASVTPDHDATRSAYVTRRDERCIRGVVAHGDQRGRELGFATANIELDTRTHHLFPADGVWAGRCVLPDSRSIPAAVSIGRRSTFYGHAGARLLEAHLLDFDEDLYGADITVHLDHWIRGQKAFTSKEDLIAALEDDVRRTRELIR